MRQHLTQGHHRRGRWFRKKSLKQPESFEDKARTFIEKERKP